MKTVRIKATLYRSEVVEFSANVRDDFDEHDSGDCDQIEALAVQLASPGAPVDEVDFEVVR